MAHFTVADLRDAMNGLPATMPVNALQPGQKGRPAQGFHITGFEEVQVGKAAETFTIEVQPNKPAA